MIEIRNFHTYKKYSDAFTGESYMRRVKILQYRHTINEDFRDSSGKPLWSNWICVPDVSEENQ